MLNKTILQGRLCADPEMRSTSGGITVTSVTLAVERGYVKTGEERKSDFIKILAWRQSGEFLSKYFCKGDMVLIEGAIQTGSYTDKNGNKKYNFEVIADQLNFCGDKKDKADTNNFDYPMDGIEDGDTDLPF